MCGRPDGRLSFVIRTKLGLGFEEPAKLEHWVAHGQCNIPETTNDSTHSVIIQATSPHHHGVATPSGGELRCRGIHLH